MVATPSLYESGLRRIAESVGFDVTDSEPAPVVLRNIDHPDQETKIDIAVEQGRVVLTVAEAPVQETWCLLGALLGHLLESGLPCG